MLAHDLMGCYDPTSTSPALTTGGDTCWGQLLTGCAAGCTPGFQPGNSHFKNKFCKACQKSLRVPAERVRVLTDTELDGKVNRRSEGFWNAEVSGVLRVVNNTATCVEPALAIYRDELPAEVRAGWSPLPTDWVDSDGYVRFCVSKGTLVPAASLRGGQLYLGPHQKRQRLGPQAVLAPHATFAPSSAERQSDDGASDSGPFAAWPVDSPSNESVHHLNVMAVPVQLPAMRVSDLQPPRCARKHGEDAEESALLERMVISPKEVTEVLGLVAPPPCAPPAQRAAAEGTTAAPPPARGKAARAATAERLEQIGLSKKDIMKQKKEERLEQMLGRGQGRQPPIITTPAPSPLKLALASGQPLYCAPPNAGAPAPPCCAPPPPGRGAAHSISPLAYVPSAQGAAPPQKTAVCAAALTAADKEVAPFPPAARDAVAAPFPPPSAAQQAARPETLLPEELAPALNSALKAVGALLDATLDQQTQLSALQQRFLRAQRRQLEESSYALNHFWRRPSQLEEHAMQVEAQLGLHCPTGVPGAPKPMTASGADDGSVHVPSINSSFKNTTDPSTSFNDASVHGGADGARGGAHGRAGESPLVPLVLGEQGRSHTHSGVAGLAAQPPSLSMMNPTRPRSATDSHLANHRSRMSGLRAAVKSMFREPRGGSIP